MLFKLPFTHLSRRHNPAPQPRRHPTPSPPSFRAEPKAKRGIPPVKQPSSAPNPTYKVVLAGNPNAGKTTLFNKLTKSNLKTGNFHGVTTAAAKKRVKGITFVDVPGMYSFNGYTMEEGCAAAEIKTADLIINVVDSLTLESSIGLTRRLIKGNKNTVVYLTKLRALRARGGSVNIPLLQTHLGVPVYADLKALKASIYSTIQAAQPHLPLLEATLIKGEGGPLRGGRGTRLPSCRAKRGIPPVKQPTAGTTPRPALAQAYNGGNAALNRAEKLFYNKFFALPFFMATLILTFFITFHPAMAGALLKGGIEGLVSGASSALSSAIKNPVVRSFICEGVVGGVGGVLSFLPQIAILYLVLILLDESGISSALSFVTDGLFEKVGLSGRAAFSMTAALGCTAAAIATTRGYAEESSRRKTVAVLPIIPCGAKLPVFLTFLAPLFKNPFAAVCILYFAGIALAVGLSALFKGERENLIAEITPVSLPQITTVIKKLCFQVKSFIIRVTGLVFLFCIASWLLSHLSFTQGFCGPQESILGAISKLICPLFYPMGVRDWRLAYAAITGFAAKENIAATVAMLIPEGLNLSLAPTAALCVFFLLCPACVSAFAASCREVGVKRTAKNNLVQLAASFIAAYITYFFFALI